MKPPPLRFHLQRFATWACRSVVVHPSTQGRIEPGQRYSAFRTSRAFGDVQ